MCFSARKVLSIGSDCKIHLAEHHIKDLLVNFCDLSYLYNIFSSRNKKKKKKVMIANPGRFTKTNSIFQNIFKAAMSSLIGNEDSFVTKLKSPLEEQDALFFVVFILLFIKYEKQAFDPSTYFTQASPHFRWLHSLL